MYEIATDGAFTTQSFKESIRKSFIACGQVPNSTGEFTLYSETARSDNPLFRSVPSNTTGIVIDLTMDDAVAAADEDSDSGSDLGSDSESDDSDDDN